MLSSGPSLVTMVPCGKGGIPRGDEILINIGRFRCFVAGEYKINRRHVAEQ